jgi:sortase A
MPQVWIVGVHAEEVNVLKSYQARRYRRQPMEKYPTRRQYRRYRRRLRARRLFTLTIVVAGLCLVTYALLLGENPLVQRAVESATQGKELAASAPKDTTLQLTIPKMARVEDLPVYDAPWDDEAAIDASAAHLDSTGFPWQDGANVYIAGHRMGFPGTRSFLVFYDLDVLENGDEVFLTDAEGTKYTYEVFDQFVTDPYDWGPTAPEAGKSILTLQSCTLPDYTQRLIVQAELTKVEPGEKAEQTQGAKTAQEVEPKQSELEQDEPAPVEPASAEIVREVEPVLVEPMPVESEAPALVQEVEPVPVEPAQVS